VIFLIFLNFFNFLNFLNLIVRRRNDISHIPQATAHSIQEIQEIQGGVVPETPNRHISFLFGKSGDMPGDMPEICRNPQTITFLSFWGIPEICREICRLTAYLRNGD